jgi:EAL domain-containing protein (putative c-di-GMP-specific phosphodiesterase class I)
MALLQRFSNSAALIVDDNVANVALFRAVLTKAGLSKVEVVTDPNQALSAYDGLGPDVVLLDLHMPGIDGFTLLAEFIKRAGASYVPVLVLTADTTRTAVHRALSLGAHDYLTKPIDTTELTLRVRNMLDTRELHDQLRHTNAALRAELAGYQWSEQAEARARAERRALVEQVLDQDLLSMVFQPIIDLKTNEPVGYEALARFPLEPVQGPEQWFADALDIGLGLELELAAVKRALDARQRVPADAFLAINVSPVTAMSPELADLLQGVADPRLVIELTEHVFVDDLGAIRNALSDLRTEGVRLAVDDTGAGYAGFRHLLGLKPDIIKLDTCLTRGIDADPARRALAAALVRFSADTEARLIAEGVESPAELTTLVDLGVEWVQGYHLAHPGPLHALENVSLGASA